MQKNNLTDTTEHFFRNLFIDLIERGDEDKVSTYFTPDATISLDGKRLSYDEFYQRVQWMKKRQFKVEFKRVVREGSSAATCHYTTITEDGASSLFKVFAWSEFEGNRLKHFEHMALRITGNASQNVVNDF